MASGLQKFDKQPQYTEVNPGEDVKLTCTIFNKRGTCSWQKNNKVSFLLNMNRAWCFEKLIMVHIAFLVTFDSRRT